MLLWTLLARKLRIWAHKAITHDLEPQLHLLITLNPPGNPKLNGFLSNLSQQNSIRDCNSIFGILCVFNAISDAKLQ